MSTYKNLAKGSEILKIIVIFFGCSFWKLLVFCVGFHWQDLKEKALVYYTKRRP